MDGSILFVSDYGLESHAFSSLLVTRASPDVTREPHEHEVKLGAPLKVLKAPVSHFLLSMPLPLVFLGHNL